MLRCMYSGISGMRVNQQKLDVIGNNIANVGTTAFKSSRAEFSDMLYQNAGVATSPTSNKGGTNAKQVGLGAKLASIDRVMSQGNALSTGRSLDACIDGEGFFIVGNGMVNYGTPGSTVTDTMGISGGNMSVNYTRDGNFQLDYEGNLVTSDGYRVMGYLVTSTTLDKDGNVIQEDKGIPKSGASSIATADEGSVKEGDCVYVNADGVLTVPKMELQPLKIPDSVYVPKYTDSEGNEVDESWQKVQSFTIGKDGVITAVLANGSRTALGQIAMASFKNPAGLTALGGNLYEVSANSGEVLVKTPVNVEVDPATGKKSENPDINDNSKGFGDMIQGCLEASNVDLTEQFTDMITATRSFQASSKMITTGDEILQTITGLMR